MPAFVPLALAGIQLASSIGSAISGSRNAKRAEQAQQAALDFEKQRWAAGQPFRDRGTALLNREVDPDAMTAMFADEGNPYAAGHTYRSPFMAMPRASQVGQPAPRTAQPRATPGGYREGGEVMAPTMAPTVDEGMASGMGDERAQMAAFAQMMAPQQTSRFRERLAARRGRGMP